MALEATTGWRFVVEELHGVGAVVHLAEPAETAERRGRKKRAKTDRADARLLRELVMAGRLPESWIAPEHILGLRARVRLRHTLVDQRGEWQQRIHAVLYHHGILQRRGLGLLTTDGRAWLDGLRLPQAAGEQVTVALQMIDKLDTQLAPIDKQLRAYARWQPGCRALMGIYGIGHVTAVAILAELGDARRFSSSREAVRYSGLDITVKQSDRRRAPGHLSRQGPPALRWALVEAAQSAHRKTSPTASTTSRRPSASAATAPAWRSRASCSNAHTTPCTSSATRHYNPHEFDRARAVLTHTDAPRPAPASRLPPRPRGRPPKTERPQRLPPAGSPHQPSCRQATARQARGPR